MYSKNTRQFRVNPTDAGRRADVFIAQNYPEFARATLSKLFDKALIMVNGQVAKRGYKLHAGDRVKADISPLKAPLKVAELPVLYEDEAIVVIDKPAGMLTHSKGSFNDESTVASFLTTKITDEKLTGNRAGIAHRLDRATSGVIIGAKTAAAQAWLQKQFSTRKVKKTYLAWAEGELDPPAALIDAPIGRNPRKPQIFMVTASGKSAQTQYQAVKTIVKNQKSYTLVELSPKTGRTHQLRVHMAYIGHPIVGDAIYGREGQQMMLHAQRLELTMPNGQRRIFKATVPDSYKDLSV